MADTFGTLIEAIISIEGGYTNDPNDRGGPTHWGVTEAVARANGYAGDMRDMTKAQAIDIYRTIYWKASGFSLVDAASHTVAAELLDTGINMGVRTASTFLQRALNAFNAGGTLYPDIAADGVCGPGTARALGSYLKLRGAEGERVMVETLNCLQGARYIELAELYPANQRFAYGWIKNRVRV